MEVIVVVCIAILSLLFLASVCVLVVICRYRHCRMFDLTLKDKIHHRSSNVTLVSHAELPNEDYEVELNDVCWNTNIDEFLEDKWSDEASGVIPHCIVILKICHSLTEKLVAVTMGNVASFKSSNRLNDIVVCAKRISPRVDEVVRSMYPPLDPKLIEARSAALLLALDRLAVATKRACCLPNMDNWINGSLAEMEKHLQILREISLASEIDSNAGSISSATESAYQPMLREDIDQRKSDIACASNSA
ncbi:transmembrane protein 98-like [Asterias amurensis]|uniref:transmembrane protein 98-like n=1 Tax=Asterias amurensis TaxID=7602 RepID=UPI003AB7468B